MNDEKTSEKKKYEPPKIETEEVFVTLALACCRVNGCVPIGVSAQANAS